MTELRERFRGLDRLPVPDLRSEIRERRPSRPPPGPPWRRLGAAVAALVVAAGGLVLAGRAFLGNGGDRPSRAGAAPASPGERAATVAIAAVTKAGLRDEIRLVPSEDAPGAEEGLVRVVRPYDYAGIRRGQEWWIAAFCASTPEASECDQEVADAFLTIVPEGKDLVVAEASGAFAEAARERLVGYAEPLDPPPAGHIYRPVGPIDVTQPGAPIGAAFYWTGAIPSNLGAVCRTEVLDAEGRITYTREFTSLAPEHEKERDGTFVLETPDGPASQAKVVCGAWQVVQAVPEGPRHVLASGVLEEGQYAGEPWRLVVWRGENVDDPRRLELWRQNAEGADVYCWGFDVDALTPLVHGQRVPPGGCSPLTDLGVSEAIGVRATGPVAGEGSNLAVGEVSTDVASLELRLEGGEIIVADLLEPPPELGIPRRFFLAFLPPGARGEMAALDASGEILATEPLRGGSAG